MAHPFGLLIFLTFVVFVIVVALWNIIPSWRKVMQSYSTIAEGGIAFLIGIFGQLSGGIQDAQAAGYIPPQLTAYIPFVLLAWFVVKRFATSTAVGEKK